MAEKHQSIKLQLMYFANYNEIIILDLFASVTQACDIFTRVTCIFIDELPLVLPAAL